MDFKDEFWPYLNDRVKFFFDSIRNLGLSVGVLIAAKYVDQNYNMPEEYFRFDSVGYGLIVLCVFHFFVGTFIYFKKSRRNTFPTQLILIILYIQILIVLFLYQVAHGK